MAKHHRLSPQREKQLVDQVRRGNRGALGELLGAYHRSVYHQCLRMLGNTEDAADVAQDAMMKAVQHIDSFRGNSRFGTWLYRIVMNLSISHLRRRKVRQATSLETPVAGEDQASELKSMLTQQREPDPDQRVETDEQVDQVMAALEQLDAPLRSVILLRDLQEMDYTQIAEVVGVPVGTVKSRLFRARVALRQALAQQGENRQRISDG
jgi:RNA polymerase sigma-70 factor (ECF subfamily)